MGNAVSAGLGGLGGLEGLGTSLPGFSMQILIQELVELISVLKKILQFILNLIESAMNLLKKLLKLLDLIVLGAQMGIYYGPYIVLSYFYIDALIKIPISDDLRLILDMIGIIIIYVFISYVYDMAGISQLSPLNNIFEFSEYTYNDPHGGKIPADNPGGVPEDGPGGNISGSRGLKIEPEKVIIKVTEKFKTAVERIKERFKHGFIFRNKEK